MANTATISGQTKPGLTSTQVTTAIADAAVGTATQTALDLKANKIAVATVAALKALLKSTLVNGQTVSTLGYSTDGTGAGTYRWDSASTATDNAGTVITPDEGGTGRWLLQDFHGTIHASVFGITTATTDQFTAYNNAVQACSAAKVVLDITGLDIRIALQSNTDAAYESVDGSSANYYAVLIPSGGFFHLTGKGTIGQLTENVKQYVHHSVDAEHIELSGGVTIDGFKSAQGYGGMFHVMGSNYTKLGAGCLQYRDGAFRNGSSAARPGQHLVIETGWRSDGCYGAFCVGPKPGGCKRITAGHIKFTNSRGGLNCDQDDLNGFAHDFPTHAFVESIETDTINGDLDPLVPVPAYAFVCTDMNGGTATLLGYSCKNHTSTLTNAAVVQVGGGQSNSPPKSVYLGPGYVENVRQIVRYSASDAGGETIIVGPVTGSGLEYVIKANVYTLTTTPEGAKLIDFQDVRIDTVSNIAFYVENTDATYTGDIIKELRINGRIETITKCAAYITDVTTLKIGDLSWGDVTTFTSGQPYSTFAFWVEVNEMFVARSLVSEDSHNSFARLEIVSRADLSGVRQVIADGGGGITLDGAGDVVLRNSEIVATGGGTGLKTDGFSGNVDLINTNLNGTGIDATLIPRKVRNSDVLKATLSAYSPGAITAGTPVTTTLTVSGARPEDRFTCAPISNTLAFQQHLDVKAYRTAANTVTFAMRNLDTGTPRDPTSSDWVIVGERG